MTNDVAVEVRSLLGLGLVRLGEHAADQTSVAMVCRPELESLTATTRLTARAAVLSDGWAVAVARVDSPDAIRLDLRLGEREWPHRSGLGKALMSFDVLDRWEEQVTDSSRMKLNLLRDQI